MVQTMVTWCKPSREGHNENKDSEVEKAVSASETKRTKPTFESTSSTTCRRQHHSLASCKESVEQ